MNPIKLPVRAELDPACEFGYWRVVEIESGKPVISICEEAEARQHADALNGHRAARLAALKEARAAIGPDDGWSSCTKHCWAVLDELIEAEEAKP